MSAGSLWSRILVIIGMILMLVGAIDPLEGALIILPGVGAVAVAALLGKSRHRRLLYWSFVLAVAGVGAMFVVSLSGGIGGNSGRSMWWGLVILPYPAGWIMGIVGAVLRLAESLQASRAARRSLRATVD